MLDPFKACRYPRSRDLWEGLLSQPELLKFALNRRIRSLGVTRKLDGGKILGLWSELVGPKIAERAHPESFTGGTLTVVVPDAAWRHQLSLSREDLKDRLNEAVGSRIVKDIYLVAVSRRKDL